MNVKPILEAIYSDEAVAGLTHTFYRYPARFSPKFVKSLVEEFTEPGDVVLDPFMGGGTTLVEATACGRIAVGNDISSLAVFLAEAKTRIYRSADLIKIRNWFARLDLSIWRPLTTTSTWTSYQKHLNSSLTWRIRKVIELVLQDCADLENSHQRTLARCILLKTAQWALDCRRQVPTVGEFRNQLSLSAEEIISGASDFATTCSAAWDKNPIEPICVDGDAGELHKLSIWKSISRPKLILTSPPYPGVHVLYHRWQVQGRRETAAPFWIAGSLDGAGASYYTFGDRKDPELRSYFDNALKAYEAIAQVCDPNTLMAQMVAFSDPDWQLPCYLQMLEEAGFREVKGKGAKHSPDSRVWRDVPNRKWYASQRGSISASKEVVLFHRLRS